MTVRRKLRLYRALDGNQYPVTEASWDISFKVYKSDKRKADIGDPRSCILALGIKHHPDVQEVFIGSGRDAYVLFKGNKNVPARAVHFTVPAEAGRVRDLFDTKGAPSTQMITLRKPTPGRTLAQRAVMNAKRRAEIKDGSPVKKRGSQVKRITRLGVPHRPRPEVVKSLMEGAAA